MPYTNKNPEGFYLESDSGWGQLDRSEGSIGSWDNNGGYGYGFYIIGMEGNNLLNIGASNPRAFYYLRGLMY